MRFASLEAATAMADECDSIKITKMNFYINEGIH
jgi:hypothetical protein